MAGGDAGPLKAAGPDENSILIDPGGLWTTAHSPCLGFPLRSRAKKKVLMRPSLASGSASLGREPTPKLRGAPEPFIPH